MTWGTQAESSPDGDGEHEGFPGACRAAGKAQGEARLSGGAGGPCGQGLQGGSSGTGIAPGVHKSRQSPREYVGTGALRGYMRTGPSQDSP